MFRTFFHGSHTTQSLFCIQLKWTSSAFSSVLNRYRPFSSFKCEPNTVISPTPAVRSVLINAIDSKTISFPNQSKACVTSARFTVSTSVRRSSALVFPKTENRKTPKRLFNKRAWEKFQFVVVRPCARSRSQRALRSFFVRTVRKRTAVPSLSHRMPFVADIGLRGKFSIRLTTNGGYGKQNGSISIQGPGTRPRDPALTERGFRITWFSSWRKAADLFYVKNIVGSPTPTNRPATEDETRGRVQRQRQ